MMLAWQLAVPENRTAMSTLTKVRDAIWQAWQREAIQQGATPPAKFWAESAAYAVIDLLREDVASETQREPGREGEDV